jgi:hypothetical protein
MAGIWDEIRLQKWQRRQCQITRYPALRAEFNCQQRSVNRLWTAAPEFLDPKDQSLWKMSKKVM